MGLEEIDSKLLGELIQGLELMSKLYKSNNQINKVVFLKVRLKNCRVSKLKDHLVNLEKPHNYKKLDLNSMIKRLEKEEVYTLHIKWHLKIEKSLHHKKLEVF